MVGSQSRRGRQRRGELPGTREAKHAIAILRQTLQAVQKGSLPGGQPAVELLEQQLRAWEAELFKGQPASVRRKSTQAYAQTVENRVQNLVETANVQARRLAATQAAVARSSRARQSTCDDLRDRGGRRGGGDRGAGPLLPWHLGPRMCIVDSAWYATRYDGYEDQPDEAAREPARHVASPARSMSAAEPPAGAVAPCSPTLSDQPGFSQISATQYREAADVSDAVLAEGLLSFMADVGSRAPPAPARRAALLTVAVSLCAGAQLNVPGTGGTATPAPQSTSTRSSPVKAAVAKPAAPQKAAGKKGTGTACSLAARLRAHRVPGGWPLRWPWWPAKKGEGHQSAVPQACLAGQARRAASRSAAGFELGRRRENRGGCSVAGVSHRGKPGSIRCQSWSRTLEMEVAYRDAAGRSASAALRRTIFAHKAIPMQSRIHVAGACVHSRCLYLAGSWPGLAGPALSKLRASYYTPLRALAGIHRPGQAGYTCSSNAAVCYHLGVAPIEWALASARLRFAAKVARNGPPYLLYFTGLEARGGELQSWRTARRFACSCPTSCRLFRSRLRTPRRAYPGAWRLVLKLALACAAANPWAADLVLQSCGVPRRTLLTEVKDESSEEDEPLCEICGRWCQPGGLEMHRIRAHSAKGTVARARECVDGSLCPVEFHSRIRLLRHLTHGAAACIHAVTSGELQPLDAQIIAAASERDRLERVMRRRLGLRDVAGAPVVRAPVVAVACAVDL